MHGNNVTDAGTGSASGIAGCPYCRHVTANHCSCVTATGFLVGNQLYLGRLDHGIGRLNHRRKTTAFDHS
jgi:hypothetical protein